MHTSQYVNLLAKNMVLPLTLEGKYIISDSCNEFVFISNIKNNNLKCFKLYICS